MQFCPLLLNVCGILSFKKTGEGPGPPPLDPQLQYWKFLVPLDFEYSKFLNPITYGGGGGFLARTIRLSTTTLKRLYLAPPNLVTFCFYLLDTLWQNFSKIDLPGGLLQLFLKWDVSKNWTYEIFVFAWKQWKYRRGYNFVPEKVFPGIKSDFCRILLESRR